MFLRATPIDVSARLQELLFDHVRAAVLTSATLAVDGGFAYLKARLGLERRPRSCCWPRPSTTARRRVLYVPAGHAGAAVARRS